MHRVAFTVLACIVDDDVLEPIHTAEVTIPARAHDTEAAIVRRAAKHLGGVAGNAWWAHDVIKTTTELADVVDDWARMLPITMPTAAYIGLATVPDDDDLYEVLHDGEGY